MPRGDWRWMHASYICALSAVLFLFELLRRAEPKEGVAPATSPQNKLEFGWLAFAETDLLLPAVGHRGDGRHGWQWFLAQAGAGKLGSRRAGALMSGHGVELAIVFLFAMLPRWRNRGGEAAAAFFNKCLRFQVPWLVFLLLAGLGGEGEKKWGAWKLERSGYPGGEADASLECKIRPFDEAPWRRSSVAGIERRCSNKRPFCVGVAGLEITALLWRGGSGEEERSLGSTASWGILMAATFGVHQWRRICVVVILGQRGHSELWRCFCHSIFNLQAGVPLRRPPFSSTAALFVMLSPSGFVPGDDIDGRRVELSSVFGGEGPSGVPLSSFRVLSVKVKGLVVFFISCLVLDVIYTPTD